MSNEIVQALLNYFPLIIPEILLVALACVLFLGGTFRNSRSLWAGTALGGLVVAAIALALTSLPTFDSTEEALASLYASPIWVDPMSILVKWIAIGGGILLVLFTWSEAPEHQAGEFHGCLITIIAGMCFVACANDLVTLFIALEMISIPTYILLYLPKPNKEGQEAAVKYFLLSIFSSALLLFGFSYLYGLTGTTNIRGIVDALGAPGALVEVSSVALVAIIMVVAGLGFKIAAVPFHFYAPDVYQGASIGGAALLAFVPKVAGFVAMIRVLGLIPYEIHTGTGLVASGGGPLAVSQVSILLWLLAAVTMTLGNVLALFQNNIRRMLAYSSVAHAGYMLIGLSLAPYFAYNNVTGFNNLYGVAAVLFYLVAYGVMTIGAFGILSLLSGKDRSVEKIEDLNGLSRTHPRTALLMALFMFSLIGMPATAGFIGKFLLFFDAFNISGGSAFADQVRFFRILALIGAINAAIAAWYYLRVITVMYLRPPLEPLAPRKALSPGSISVFACAALTLFFGIYPSPLVNKARSVVRNKLKVVEPEPQPQAKTE